MNPSEIITIFSSFFAIAVAVTTLIGFSSKRREKMREEGAREAEMYASLEIIKHQNKTIIEGNEKINHKLEEHNSRLARIDQTIIDAKLSEMPGRLSELEGSVKSAHKRIDEIKLKINGGTFA